MSENNIMLSQGGNTFPITGQVDNTTYTADANFSSFQLNNTYGYTTISDDYVKYTHSPSISESATWIDILHKANEPAAKSYNVSAYAFTGPAASAEFQLSAISGLNEIHFIGPRYGSHDWYSAFFYDGPVMLGYMEIASGCWKNACKAWSDDDSDWKWFVEYPDGNYGLM